LSTFSNANPFDFKPKTAPGAWITWLSEPLSDPAACLLPLFIQSRTVVPKDDEAGSMGDWATKHGLLMEETAESIRAKGRTVLLEQPIAITSRTGVTVSGSMDIWVKEDAAARQAGMVIDAKTGKKKAAHRSQVNLYQLLLQASPDFTTSTPPSGGLVYGDGTKVNVPAEEASPALRAKLGRLLEAVAADVAPDPIPSSSGCRFCRLKEWCPSASNGRPKPPVVEDF
jgi:CRISPR/Cas system-associated exonuclease Cas4 (RecB family)